MQAFSFLGVLKILEKLKI